MEQNESGAEKTVPVPLADLNTLEQRASEINTKIHGLVRLIKAGDMERAVSLAWMLQELNVKQLHGLHQAGAVDSVAVALGGFSAVWDEDEPPVDADRLDLSQLGAAMTGQNDEG